MALSFPQIEDAARQLDDIDPCLIQAVAAIESGGKGFLPDGLPVVRFEKHVFLRELGNKKASADHVAAARALTGVKWDTLKKAMVIDEEAALLSASFGMFQIMGFNHKACGFSSVFAFVEAQKESEEEQLASFCAFLRSENLVRFFKAFDWAGIARRYNGPGYAQNQYDRKLKQAYECCKAAQR